MIVLSTGKIVDVCDAGDLSIAGNGQLRRGYDNMVFGAPPAPRQELTRAERKELAGIVAMSWACWVDDGVDGIPCEE